jgi:hypothetical protein
VLPDFDFVITDLPGVVVTWVVTEEGVSMMVVPEGDWTVVVTV